MDPDPFLLTEPVGALDTFFLGGSSFTVVVAQKVCTFCWLVTGQVSLQQEPFCYAFGKLWPLAGRWSRLVPQKGDTKKGPPILTTHIGYGSKLNHQGTAGLVSFTRVPFWIPMIVSQPFVQSESLSGKVFVVTTGFSEKHRADAGRLSGRQQMNVAYADVTTTTL